MSELTQPVDWLNRQTTGYMVNTVFSDQNADIVHGIIDRIAAAFPDIFFGQPKPALHITLLDWIAPLVNYDGRDKSELFKQVQPSYDVALSRAIANYTPFPVHFTEIKVAPSTIFIKATDNGQFQSIRDQFVTEAKLLPGTKLPPTIVHSSIGRFTKEVELAPIEAFVAHESIDLYQEITSFRLVHSRVEPMLDFDVVKEYPLGH
jgi:hypothetical protein